MSTYMLRSGDIWLSEAVELAASRWFPAEWSNSTLSEDDTRALGLYRSELKLFEQRSAALTEVGTLAGLGGLNRLFLDPDQGSTPTSAPQKPTITPLAELAHEKELLRQEVVNNAWKKIRQALVDGVLAGRSFLETEDHADVPAMAWGSPPNADCHLPWRRVYLGKSDAGNGLKGGRPYLSKTEFDGFLDGSPKEVEAVANVGDRQGKPKRSSPKLDLARELVSRAYPNGISDSDRTVEIINRAQREHRQDDGPRPSDDVIKRAIGRKKV